MFGAQLQHVAMVSMQTVLLDLEGGVQGEGLATKSRREGEEGGRGRG